MRKKPDWTRVEEQSTWLAELPAPKNLIGGEWESKSTWLVGLPAPKNLIGREWESKSTWLDERGRAKAPDWTRVGEWNHLIGWTPNQKKPDWSIFICAKICLVDFYMCWNLIGRFYNVFSLSVLMFFWPLRMTHRCSFDLWSWLIDVLLTFEHDSSRFCWLLVLMFFWPLTFDPDSHIQTHFISYDPPYSRGKKKHRKNQILIYFSAI
jgi:hypothetical protein